MHRGCWRHSDRALADWSPWKSVRARRFPVGLRRLSLCMLDHTCGATARCCSIGSVWLRPAVVAAPHRSPLRYRFRAPWRWRRWQSRAHPTPVGDVTSPRLRLRSCRLRPSCGSCSAYAVPCPKHILVSRFCEHGLGELSVGLGHVALLPHFRSRFRSKRAAGSANAWRICLLPRCAAGPPRHGRVSESGAPARPLGKHRAGTGRRAPQASAGYRSHGRRTGRRRRKVRQERPSELSPPRCRCRPDRGATRARGNERLWLGARLQHRGKSARLL